MDEKIKVFTPDEKSLKTLGELLSNDTSRKIIKILIEDEMYVNQISVKLSITPNLVTHHLKKLESLGLVNVTSKPISRKTKNHNFYKIRNDIFVDLKPKEDKLKRIFRRGVKIASVGVGATMSLFLLNYNPNKIPINRGSSPINEIDKIDIFRDTIHFEFTYFSIFITSLIIGGFAIFYLLNKKRKN